MPTEKTAKLEALAQALQNLRESPLYDYRVTNNYKPVLGEGAPEADIMFIGEAPGEREAKTGRPFVGASGKFLDELLTTIGLSRQHVYITNVVKDRPPDNRDPRPAEIALYTPLLTQQIALIQPKVIVTLGRFAMDFILKHFEMAEQGQKISVLHGQLLTVAGRPNADRAYGQMAVLPLFHPAVALYNRGQRETLMDDFQSLKPYVPSQLGAQSKAAGSPLPEVPPADLLALIDHLRQIADLLEAQGANNFRIRAYHQGISRLQNADPSLIDLVRAGDIKGLMTLPGIGKGLAATMVEFVQTGKTALLDELRKV